MPAIAPLPPAEIRRLLEAPGYRVAGEDHSNWAFASSDDDEPVMVPHAVDLVPLEIALQVAGKVGFNDYFGALAPPSPEPSRGDGNPRQPSS